MLEDVSWDLVGTPSMSGMFRLAGGRHVEGTQREVLQLSLPASVGVVGHELWGASFLLQRPCCSWPCASSSLAATSKAIFLTCLCVRCASQLVLMCSLSLQGCVFTRDINQAMRISDAMETGTVQVSRVCCNETCALGSLLPFTIAGWRRLCPGLSLS